MRERSVNHVTNIIGSKTLMAGYCRAVCESN